MGYEKSSRTAYTTATKAFTSEGKSETHRGEQHVKDTGKLNPLVDPAEYGVIRESRLRLTQQPNGLWELNVGATYSKEYRLDTTGSMGDNVRRALRVLPDICELTERALPGRDVHYCASIFGDVVDRFVLCRGQFEMTSARMVDQLTLMHPEGGGDDWTEDPQYGLFGAAYLSQLYLQRAGLKTYDYTITDAPARDRVSLNQLKRVFGDSVMEKVKENGYRMSSRDLPTTREISQDLDNRAHRFCIVVKNRDTIAYWRKFFDSDHVVYLPNIDHVAYAMATMTGLTEGTIGLQSAVDFLREGNLTKQVAQTIVDAVSGIPLGAQRNLPNYNKLPVKGDLFLNKDDVWPLKGKNLEEALAAGKGKSGKVGGSVDTASNAPVSKDDAPGWL